MNMERIRKLLLSEQGKYLFFGVLTTVVNYVVFWVATRLLGTEPLMVQAANVLAFVLAATFAFFTNKRFVFQSTSWRWQVVLREAGSFFAARIFAFGVEALGLFLSQTFLPLEQFQLFFVDGVMVAKVVLSVVSVLLNYVFSKWFVFRKGDKGERA